MHTETYNLIINYINDLFSDINNCKFSKKPRERIYISLYSIIYFLNCYTNTLTNSEYIYLNDKLEAFLHYDECEIYYEYNRTR